MTMTDDITRANALCGENVASLSLKGNQRHEVAHRKRAVQ